MIVSAPVPVVTVAWFAKKPFALFVEPLPLTPVIDTLPAPPACTLDNDRFTPGLFEPPPPRPSSVIFPPVVFTFTAVELNILTPTKLPV